MAGTGVWFGQGVKDRRRDLSVDVLEIQQTLHLPIYRRTDNQVGIREYPTSARLFQKAATLDPAIC